MGAGCRSRDQPLLAPKVDRILADLPDGCERPAFAHALVVNFLGHAHAARWQDRDPRFVLGAMLPDLANMAGVRRPVPKDAVVATGVAFHHRTDAAFHGCPTFERLSHAGSRALQDAGMSRGPALAASHIAIELLLDASLADDAKLVADYTAALRSELVLDEPGPTIALARVCTRLHEAGAPRWYGVLDEMVPRLERILSRHRRLALVPDDHGPLRAWLAEVQPQVAAAGDRMLDELRARLPCVTR